MGTKDDNSAVAALGVEVVRIATHCTEADISEQHFGLARDAGMESVGFLMLAHMMEPEVLAKQARIMVDAGCQCVYVVDSAGALVLEQARDRIAALLDEVDGEAQVGFHGHRNLGLAEANSVLAIRAGAQQIDGCLRGLGAGAGNTLTEVLVAVCERLGVRTGVDLFGVLDAAEDIVRPIMEEECALDRVSVTMGYAGVYSRFLKHARRVAGRYDVPDTELIVRAGQRQLVGGQEDQLIDIALEVRDEQEGSTA